MVYSIICCHAKVRKKKGKEQTWAQCLLTILTLTDPPNPVPSEPLFGVDWKHLPIKMCGFADIKLLRWFLVHWQYIRKNGKTTFVLSNGLALGALVSQCLYVSPGLILGWRFVIPFFLSFFLTYA